MTRERIEAIRLELHESRAAARADIEARELELAENPYVELGHVAQSGPEPTGDISPVERDVADLVFKTNFEARTSSTTSTEVVDDVLTESERLLAEVMAEELTMVRLKLERRIKQLERRLRSVERKR